MPLILKGQAPELVRLTNKVLERRMGSAHEGNAIMLLRHLLRAERQLAEEHKTQQQQQQKEEKGEGKGKGKKGKKKKEGQGNKEEWSSEVCNTILEEVDLKRICALAAPGDFLPVSVADILMSAWLCA